MSTIIYIKICLCIDIFTILLTSLQYYMQQLASSSSASSASSSRTVDVTIDSYLKQYPTQTTTYLSIICVDVLSFIWFDIQKCKGYIPSRRLGISCLLYTSSHIQVLQQGIFKVSLVKTTLQQVAQVKQQGIEVQMTMFLQYRMLCVLKIMSIHSVCSEETIPVDKT